LDLCCGIGGDLVALGSVCTSVVGVDRDETHAICARHNAGVYDVDASLVVCDVSDVHAETVAAVFIDPARRAGDRRGGSSPPLDWCFSAPNRRVCVKAAPGLDRDLVPAGWETEFVADRRELKEAVLWSPAWASGVSRATVLPGGDTLVADPATPSARIAAPGKFLIDPSPAITRAGAVADLAALLGCWQIDPRIAFLSADLPVHSPFGRTLVVEASLPFGVKPVGAELRRLGVASVDIRRRGLAGDVDDLRRRWRGVGDRTAIVVLTRVADRPWAFVCSEPVPA
jgi:hypothetical protein